MKELLRENLGKEDEVARYNNIRLWKGKIGC